MPRRVVVTGIGVVSPVGIGVKAFWDAVQLGRSGIGPLSEFDTLSLPSHLGAMVQGFSPYSFMEPGRARKLDRVSQMAVASARLALEDGGLQVTPTNRNRIGRGAGPAFGGLRSQEEFAAGLVDRGFGNVSPMIFPNSVMSAGVGHCSIVLGFTGVNTTVNHREVSAEGALCLGWILLRSGKADAVLAGGMDELSRWLFYAFCRFGALAPSRGGEEVCCPFDQRRNGQVLGEGAAFLLLEGLEEATRRGAKIYAELVGMGLTDSGGPLNCWAPDPSQRTRAMALALAQGGLAPSDLDLVLPSANSTRDLDRIEANALCRLLGDETERVPVSALAPIFGSFGAAGALRVAVATLAIHDGAVPPTLNFHTPDPELPCLNLAAVPRYQRVRSALVNGVATGGSNIALLFQELPGR